MDQISSSGPPLEPKPGMVQAIAIMTLVNGILEFPWACSLATVMVSTCVGVLAIPLAIYPLVLGVFEIIYAAKLLPNPPKPVQPARYLAIMEICNIITGDIVSLTIGILALVFYNDPRVQAYFDRLNAPQYGAGPPTQTLPPR